MVTLLKSVLIPLCVFLYSLRGEATGVYFVDWMILKACHIKREKQHQVLNGIAQKGKSSMGWFFGFKLPLVINDKGELMAFKVTVGNINDRKPVPDVVKKLMGRAFGNKAIFPKLYLKNLHYRD